VDVLLGRSTERILGEAGRVSGLRFAAGEEVDADLVVISIGIRPEKMLALAAGIRCDRGIVVDDRMLTSAPNVAALGECAEHRGVLYGLVSPIREQAQVAADTLLGHSGPAYGGSL